MSVLVEAHAIRSVHVTDDDFMGRFDPQGPGRRRPAGPASSAPTSTRSAAPRSPARPCSRPSRRRYTIEVVKHNHAGMFILSSLI
ncbi:MAG: hypothetical protein MZV70_10510 [Desulfobacterales bacterium]|nr:hypothetical protein [Desulfobacterales bacterium]